MNQSGVLLSAVSALHVESVAELLDRPVLVFELLAQFSDFFVHRLALRE